MMCRSHFSLSFSVFLLFGVNSPVRVANLEPRALVVLLVVIKKGFRVCWFELPDSVEGVSSNVLHRYGVT